MSPERWAADRVPRRIDASAVQRGAARLSACTCSYCAQFGPDRHPPRL